MNRNSGFPTFGVISLCVLTIFLSSITLKLHDIFHETTKRTLNAIRPHAKHMNV